MALLQQECRESGPKKAGVWVTGWIRYRIVRRDLKKRLLPDGGMQFIIVAF